MLIYSLGISEGGSGIFSLIVSVTLSSNVLLFGWEFSVIRYSLSLSLIMASRSILTVFKSLFFAMWSYFYCLPFWLFEELYWYPMIYFTFDPFLVWDAVANLVSRVYKLLPSLLRCETFPPAAILFYLLVDTMFEAYFNWFAVAYWFFLLSVEVIDLSFLLS